MHRKPMTQAAHHQQHHEHRHQAHDASAPNTAMHLDLVAVHALAIQPPSLTASIYLPTHRFGPDRQQDHTRAKNLLHQARRMLDATAGEQRAGTIIAPALTAIEHPDFWTHPGDGLALFCRESGFQHLWVPATMPEQAMVSEHCHIKPLMPLLQGDGRFYLLELTQHGVHLYTGSRFGLSEIALPGAPASIDEALGHPESEHHTEVRTVHAAGRGAPHYFGTVGDERAKDRIKEYFRRVDTCVCGLLHDQRAPLVTAGVEYLLPLYWEVNHYPHLVQGMIPGNPDHLTSISLHDRAWAVVAPQFAKAADAARERYAPLRGSERASNDLSDILRAAVLGRVEDLFVASDCERWGSYDKGDDKLREHDPRWPDDDDLLNLALISALATRAHVQVVPQALMPHQSVIAAVFRY